MLRQIETLINDYYPVADDPGCSVLLARGEETHTWARGIADVETGTRITAETNFRLASVSKQFTAVCVLQLREAGRLHLDQRLTDYFPDFAPYGHGIQVKHLLRHTSGLKDYEKLLPPDSSSPVSDADVVELLSHQDACDFEPGSEFRYSNSGYAVLAMVVETLSGLSFPDYLRQHIFEPLRMTNTLAYVDQPGAPEVPHRAIGYALNDAGEFDWADQNVTTAVLGDGGIYCSAEDYNKWIRGYHAGAILKPETVAEALQSGKTTDGEMVPYGYGWRLEPLSLSSGSEDKTNSRPNQNMVWRPYHPGSTSGFRNGVIMDPSGEWVVLVLSNRCNGDAVSLASEIAHIVETL